MISLLDQLRDLDSGTPRVDVCAVERGHWPRRRDVSVEETGMYY